MPEESLVPSAKTCGWLKENGWTAKTVTQWRKYSLNDDLILLPNDEGADVGIAVLSGAEQYRLAAPTARELIAEIPKQVIITHNNDKSFHVSTKIDEGQHVYKINDSLEEALALLWILLQRIDK